MHLVRRISSVLTAVDILRLPVAIIRVVAINRIAGKTLRAHARQNEVAAGREETVKEHFSKKPAR